MNRRMHYVARSLFAVVLAAAMPGPLPRAAAQTAPPAPAGAASYTDPAMILRGAYVAKLGDCAGCHTASKTSAPFAGGLPMGSPFGTIYSTNITPDPQAGIGRYSYADFERVLRDGIAPGGKRLYPAMPYASFSKISDADLQALYAYFMHGVQPVASRPPETDLPFPFDQRWGLAAWDFMFAAHERYEPSPDRSVLWNRGAYLVQSLGHCGACHTPRGTGFEERGYDQSSSHYLAGGFNDNWYAPSLRGSPGSGLGRLSEQDIASFLKTGHAGHVHIVAFGSMVQVVEDSTQYFSDADLRAIAHYLKSLPATEPSTAAYQPWTAQAQQSVAALKTGDVERPGAGFYMTFCVKCHKADGRGETQKFPALAGNPVVLAPDASSLIRLLVEGGSSPHTDTGPKSRKMPSFAKKLNDQEIAQVLTFVRSTWGNKAPAVLVRDVSKVRGKLHE